MVGEGKAKRNTGKTSSSGEGHQVKGSGVIAKATPTFNKGSMTFYEESGTCSYRKLL